MLLALAPLPGEHNTHRRAARLRAEVEARLTADERAEAVRWAKEGLHSLLAEATEQPLPVNAPVPAESPVVPYGGLAIPVTDGVSLLSHVDVQMHETLLRLSPVPSRR